MTAIMAVHYPHRHPNHKALQCDSGWRISRVFVKSPGHARGNLLISRGYLRKLFQSRCSRELIHKHFFGDPHEAPKSAIPYREFDKQREHH